MMTHLFNHSFIDGHSSCFYHFANLNNAATNILYIYPCVPMLLYLQYGFLKVDLFFTICLIKTFPYNISGHFPCYCPFLKPLIHLLSFGVPMLLSFKNSSSVSVLSCQLDYKNRNSLRAGMVYYTVYRQ